MAVFTPGAIISEIRGSVGDVNYSRNKSGPIVRSKLIQPPSATARQIAARDSFALIQSNWAGLLQWQRDTWINYAKRIPYKDRLGKTRFYSPYNLYMKLNLNRRLIGQSATTAILFDPEYPVISNVRLEASGSDYVVNWDITPVGWTWRTRIYTTGKVSNGITKINPSVFRASTNWYDIVPNPGFDPFAISNTAWGESAFVSGEVMWMKLHPIQVGAGWDLPYMFFKFTYP